MSRRLRKMAHKEMILPLGFVLVLMACSDGGSEPEVDTPPAVRGVVLGHDGSARVAPAAATFAPGDTVFTNIYASSSSALTWMGIITAVDGIRVRDSIAVPSELAGQGELVVDYELRVPASFFGTLDLIGFARDTHGLLTEARLENTPVSIWQDVVVPSGRSVALPAPVVDVAVDALGERAYFALTGRPEVAVLDLGSMTFLASIAVPVPPTAVDVSSVTGTIVVALPRVEQVPVTHGLGILDPLVPGQVDVVLLPREPAEFNRGPSALRVTSRNEALIVMSINGSGEAGYLFGYDLAARSFRGGSALGVPDRIDNDTKLARSANGTRVLFYYGGSCCPTSGQLYDATQENVSSVQNGVHWFGAPLSLTEVGDRTLIKASLYGAALQPVQEYHPPGEGEGSVLSEDGAYAYFRVGGGFLRTHLADGVSRERFVLPETPSRLVRVPGPAERVLAFSSTTAYLTDIQSSVGSTALRFAPPSFSREPYQSVSR